MFQYSPVLGRSSIWDLKYTFFLQKEQYFETPLSTGQKLESEHNQIASLYILYRLHTVTKNW